MILHQGPTCPILNRELHLIVSLGQLWEDEETQSFYETLVDLKAFIPAILYKDSSAAGNEKTPAEEEDPAALEATEEDFESEMVVDDEGEIAPPDLEDDAEDDLVTGLTLPPPSSDDEYAGSSGPTAAAGLEEGLAEGLPSSLLPPPLSLE